MTQRLPLSKRVRKATLSRFIPIIAASLIAALVISFAFINLQIAKSHQAHLSEFSASYYRSIAALNAQIASLARNDLMINSLIDFSNRDSYLPVFFRSLTPTNLTSVDSGFSIAFTDFEGEVITGNFTEAFKEVEQHFAWKEQALEKGLPFIEVGKNGLMIVHPVIYGGSAEGAIALHIQSLSSVLRVQTGEYNLVVTDDSSIIFEANEQFVGKGLAATLDIDSGVAGMITNSKLMPLNNNKRFDPSDLDKALTATIVQPYLSAYSDAGWVIGALALALTTILFSTLFSIRLTSNIASRIIDRLRDQIGAARDKPGSFKKIEPTKSESREIFELRQTFNSVMEELLATTFVKERVEGVIDSLGEMLVVYDLQGELVMANTAFASLCSESGTSPEASREYVFNDGFVVPQASNSPTIMKHYHQDANRIRHVSWMRTLYTDTDDNIIGIVLTGVDLTEVIELQQELSLKNQAIDEAQTPIIIANATEQGFPISYVNRAFEHQTGYTFDEVKDTSCKFLQGENTDPKEVEKISKALRELQPVTTTILNYRKDGSEFYNRLSLTPIRDLGGEVTHFLGLQSDVTDQERTQQYLEQARIKAEDSAKLKAEFLASMSHEIRTPMNGILGMLGLLESTTLNKEQDQHVRLAKSSADALLVLINDILDFSKIEAGKLSLEQVDFDIGNLVAEIASSVACVAEDKQLEIVLDISDVAHRGIVGDPGRTRQILNNLIGNAIKFTNHGHVLISAKTSVNDDGKCICEIAIKDTGAGIPRDRVNVIFDAFSQVDASTTRKFGGTGLGLTICKQLAELLDGDITVTSEIGRGSEFTFKFAAELAKSQPKAAEHSEFSEISVAHLDAAAPCLESVKRQLGKWGVESSQFCEPDSLLSEIRSQHIDIVLISAGIPGLDASKLSAEIREHSCNPAIKLCLLTRLSDVQNGTDLSTMPVDGYFPKPVTPNELRDALLTLSSNRSEADPKQEEPSDIPKNYKGLHALLVEDNPINQVLAVTLLEDLGLDVKVANHGKEAIETLKKDAPYHLVFMDCQMPEMDGYEATRHIRNGECGTSNQNIPIIAMTANAIAGDREKCLDAGMSDYISKPIDTQILEQKVAYWAEEAGENREDEASKEASLSHHPVDIAKTEDTQRETKPTQSKEERSDMSNSNEKAVPTEVWDKAAALERTIGREDLLCRVIDAYLADTPPHVEQLSNAVEDKDMEQIAYLAHTIKGASLNISAAQVSKLAQQLETDAKEGRSDRFSSILPQLQQESEQLFLLLREYTALKAS